MLKNNSGITYITLVFIVIVLLILTSIFIATGLNALDETRKTELQNEIHMLEEAALTRYASYVKSDKNVPLIGSLPSTRWASAEECASEVVSVMTFKDDVTDSEKDLKKTTASKNIIRDYDEYVRILNSGDARILDVEAILPDNVYVVDYYTSTVYGPLK